MPLLCELVGESTKVSTSHVRKVGDLAGAGIPLIDLQQLEGPGRRGVVEAIGSACEKDGVFMVTNHGIPEAVVEGMLSVARELFHVQVNIGGGWVPNALLINIGDQLLWQEAGTYSTEARALALRLLEAISESLGLERGHQLVNAMGRPVDVAVGVNAPAPVPVVDDSHHRAQGSQWPQPEPTHELPAHKNPSVITLLLHDDLQVQRDGRWVAVHPVPNALVISIGDQLQERRNESVNHRNSESERISVPTTFSCPTPEVDAPVPVVNDSRHLVAYYGRLLLLAIVAVSVVLLMIALFTKHASTVLAAMALASGTTLQIAPVFDVVTAVKSKQVNDMNPVKAILSLFAGYASIAYAFMSLPLNFYVIVPILTGVAAALLYITVYMVLVYNSIIRDDDARGGPRPHEETPDLFTSSV